MILLHTMNDSSPCSSGAERALIKPPFLIMMSVIKLHFFFLLFFPSKITSVTQFEHGLGDRNMTNVDHSRDGSG
jgi:hypothetical protein